MIQDSETIARKTRLHEHLDICVCCTINEHIGQVNYIIKYILKRRSIIIIRKPERKPMTKEALFVCPHNGH